MNSKMKMIRKYGKKIVSVNIEKGNFFEISLLQKNYLLHGSLF